MQGFKDSAAVSGFGAAGFPRRCSGMALAQNPSPRLPAPAPLPPPGTGASMMTRLQFPNTDVKEVLSFYERMSKKRLVIDNQVQGTVNIVVAGEVTVEEAMRIIEINLLLNGFTLVPAEGDNQTVSHVDSPS